MQGFGNGGEVSNLFFGQEWADEEWNLPQVRLGESRRDCCHSPRTSPWELEDSSWSRVILSEEGGTKNCNLRSSCLRMIKETTSCSKRQKSRGTDQGKIPSKKVEIIPKPYRKWYFLQGVHRKSRQWQIRTTKKKMCKQLCRNEAKRRNWSPAEPSSSHRRKVSSMMC